MVIDKEDILLRLVPVNYSTVLKGPIWYKTALIYGIVDELTGIFMKYELLVSPKISKNTFPI